MKVLNFLFDLVKHFFSVETDKYFEFEKVLDLFLENKDRQFRGSEVCQETGLPTGWVYPLLAKMHEKEWLDLELKDNPESARYKLHLYKLTEGGYLKGLDFKNRLRNISVNLDLMPDFI